MNCRYEFGIEMWPNHLTSWNDMMKLLCNDLCNTNPGCGVDFHLRFIESCAVFLKVFFNMNDSNKEKLGVKISPF